MKKLLIALLVFGVLVAFSATAFATLIGGPPGQQKKDEAWAYLSINEQEYAIEAPKVLPTGIVQWKKTKIKTDEFEFELDLGGDVDPYLTYNLSAQNLSVSSVYVLHIGAGIPLIPTISGANTVFATLVAGLIDYSPTQSGLSITPEGDDYDGDGVLEVASHWVMDAEGNTANLGVDLGSAYSGGTTSLLYHAPEESGPVGDWVHMWEEIEFTIGPQSGYNYSGYLSIQPDESAPPVAHTPEPGTLMLLGSGLLGLGAMGFRRYRKKEKE